jgi:hypothetical protein
VLIRIDPGRWPTRPHLWLLVWTWEGEPINQCNKSYTHDGAMKTSKSVITLSLILLLWWESTSVTCGSIPWKAPTWDLILGVCILLRVWDQVMGCFYPPTQRHYRMLILLYCYMFRFYDHLQVENI